MGERTGKETNVSPLLMRADDKLEAIYVDDDAYRFDPPWTSPVMGRPIVEIDFDAGTARVVGFREIVDLEPILAEIAESLIEARSQLRNNGERFTFAVMLGWREITGDERLDNVYEQSRRIIEALAFAWDQGYDPEAPYERISKEISDA